MRLTCLRSQSEVGTIRRLPYLNQYPVSTRHIDTPSRRCAADAAAGQGLLIGLANRWQSPYEDTCISRITGARHKVALGLAPPRHSRAEHPQKERLLAARTRCAPKRRQRQRQQAALLQDLRAPSRRNLANLLMR